MVMDYGMSRLGRVNYRQSQRSIFLAAGPSDEMSRHFSEQTSREIDQEVRRIINDAIEKVRHILDHRRAALEALADKLIEVESVDADELKRIIEAASPGPSIVPGTADIPARPQPEPLLGHKPDTGLAEAT
jgi:cell division protease FtsH